MYWKSSGSTSQKWRNNWESNKKAQDRWRRGIRKMDGSSSQGISPDQNGVAERANRTIMERVKSIIAEAKLDRQLWMEIADTVIYLKNRNPTSAVATTPYELWHGVKPNLSHLRIIGSTSYIHIPKKSASSSISPLTRGSFSAMEAQISTEYGI